MIRPAAVELDWGPAQIELLLPQRAPLRLVDRVERFVPGSQPRLRAGLELRGDEPVFAGHFPGRPVWPGAYQIEGLAQAAGLLLALRALHERGGAQALRAGPSSSLPRAEAPAALGLLARAEASFLAVVEPPARLRYELRLLSLAAGIARLEGQVSAAGRCVAEGAVVVSLEEPR